MEVLFQLLTMEQGTISTPTDILPHPSVFAALTVLPLQPSRALYCPIVQLKFITVFTYEVFRSLELILQSTFHI